MLNDEEENCRFITKSFNNEQVFSDCTSHPLMTVPDTSPLRVAGDSDPGEQRQVGSTLGPGTHPPQLSDQPC